MFAQTTTTHLGRPRAPDHAVPVRRQPRLRASAAASRRAGLEAVARHRLPGGIPVGAIYWSSLRVGKWVGAAGAWPVAGRPDPAEPRPEPPERMVRPRNRPAILDRTCTNPSAHQAARLRARATRKVRAARKFACGLTDTAHPLLVQIIPIRRCNIDCGYCNEYDKVSPAGADRRDAARGSTSWPTLGTLGRRLQRRRADAPSGSRRR